MCAVTPSARLTLAMDERAARRARTFLRDTHCTAHAAAVLDDAQLLVSELVTNAVRYGAPPITVELECDESTGLTARISDGDPRLPSLGHAHDQDESGRGVALVDLISDAWGIEPSSAGKGVWFRFNRDHEAAS
jgi:anti-sigma regulatory factor (Ser/Thr protein kinase)